MGLKTFDEVGNVGFSKSWQEENKDLIIEMKAGEVRELRFIDAFLPMALHWVPFLSKRGGKVRFFPQMCLKWNLLDSVIDEDARCPACDRDINVNENGIFWVVDVEALFNGDKNRAVKIFEIGSRERKKLSNLAKFNKVKGTPYHVGHSRYGRVVQVNYDPNNSDKSLRWQFSKGDRLPVKITDNATTLKVKIPEDAESDYAGKIFTFELQDLLEIVQPPEYGDTKQKFKRMKVDQAIDRLDREDKNKDGDDFGGDDDNRQSRRNRGSRGGSPRRQGRDDDNDDRRGGRRRNLDEDPEDDDFGDEDKDEDASGKDDDRRDRRRGKKDVDDFGDDEGPQCNKKSSRGKRCPRHKGCFGDMGATETEDCTICTHRDDCLDVNQADDDD